MLESIGCEGVHNAGQAGVHPLVQGLGIPVVLGVGGVAAAPPAAQRVQPDSGIAADTLAVTQLRLGVTVHLAQLDVGQLIQQTTCNTEPKYLGAKTSLELVDLSTG